MAVIRLPEGEIIWGNDGFYAITGLSDGCRYQTLESVVPGFTTGWLREGRNELPGDQLIGTRRYRIYGNYVRSEDDATTVRLATIFFADMTEMFNVRDEFLRTRPITAVILIDNYDELMSNLPDRPSRSWTRRSTRPSPAGSRVCMRSAARSSATGICFCSRARTFPGFGGQVPRFSTPSAP